jgi:hypothetical protein
VTAPALQTALRACAAGLYTLEAGVDLLIAHAWLLDRSDFRDRYVHHGISITDGTTDMAEIDWAAAINALDTGELPCSGGERRILRLAASLASGITVDLRDAVTGLDHRNIDRLVNAILHASGQRQQHNRPNRP